MNFLGKVFIFCFSESYMAHRIEVMTRKEVADTRAKVREERLRRMGFEISDVAIVDVYTLDSGGKLREELNKTASLLSNPVSQVAKTDEPQIPENFDWAIEVGYLPGVTDNVGNTATELMRDAFGADDERAYASQITFVRGCTREVAGRRERELPEEGPGLQIFRNGVEYFR
jgi:phosphoribosylformylglycinamidine synthase